MVRYFYFPDCFVPVRKTTTRTHGYILAYQGTARTPSVVSDHEYSFSKLHIWNHSAGAVSLENQPTVRIVGVGKGRNLTHSKPTSC